MKLQRQASRKTKNKTYEKWLITMPANLIKKLEWQAGDDIEAELDNNKIILSQKAVDSKKEKIKIGTGKELSFFERFNMVYCNLPFSERSLAIVVMEGEPVSWKMAYKEIRAKTKLGKKIGQKLIKLGIV